MSGVSMTVVNELCEIVTKKAAERRNYLVKKHEAKTARLAEELYKNKMKSLKIDKDLETLEDIRKECEALDKLQRAKESDKTSLARKIISTIEKAEPELIENSRWNSEETRVEQMRRKVVSDTQTEAMYTNPDVGPVLKELDETIADVRERILLATSNNAVRTLVAEILETLEKLVKIE